MLEVMAFAPGMLTSSSCIFWHWLTERQSWCGILGLRCCPAPAEWWGRWQWPWKETQQVLIKLKHENLWSHPYFEQCQLLSDCNQFQFLNVQARGPGGGKIVCWRSQLGDDPGHSTSIFLQVSTSSTNLIVHHIKDFIRIYTNSPCRPLNQQFISPKGSVT